MSDPMLLRQRLKDCPAGQAGWREFERVCTDTLEYLFVPPLIRARRQSSNRTRTKRRDAILANRSTDYGTNWGRLYREHRVRMIPFEFKNCDLEDIGSDDVEQVVGYMEEHFGELAILCCNKGPCSTAFDEQRDQFIKKKRLILILTPTELLEMISIRERGDDPSNMIMDLIEDVYCGC
ncbi:MAG: hypothetical protein EOP62_10885 [Sphingomonadales bacterium]|nr:MAG: hypothetical protein EOP62_10885 [Sphingomonadales bacterium]